MNPLIRLPLNPRIPHMDILKNTRCFSSLPLPSFRPAEGGSKNTFSLASMSFLSNKTFLSKVQSISEKFFKSSNTKAVLVGAGIVLLAYLVYKEIQSPTLATEAPKDSQWLQDLEALVQRYNLALEQNTPECSTLFREGIVKIQLLSHLGNLTQMPCISPNFSLARRGLLILSECHDFTLQRAAFTRLQSLLKKPLNPTEPINEFLILEKKLGDRLIESSEVNHAVSLLHELVYSYKLVLEKIFFYGLAAGANISNETKFSIVSRAQNVSKKLKRNPAFQFEALNAEAIARYLQSPSQPVTEAIKAINSLHQQGQDSHEEVQSLVWKILYNKLKKDELQNFLLIKGPSLIQGIEEPLRRLAAIVTDNRSGTDIHEAILLLKPSQDGAEVPIEILFEMIDKEKKSVYAPYQSEKRLQSLSSHVLYKEASWVPFYCLLENLSEIIFSTGHHHLKQQAIEKVIEQIDSNAPFQIRYQLGAILVKLKQDPLFQSLAEEGLSKQMLTPSAHLNILQSLNWLESLYTTLRTVDQKLNKSYSQPQATAKTKFQLNSFTNNGDLLIPREEPLEKITKEFREKGDTIAQVIRGTGGVGKSSLASLYAHLYGKDYTRVHWITGKTLNQDLEELADSLGIPQGASEQRREILKEWLEQDNHRGWLLIVDNVDDHKDLEEMSTILPKQGGHVLITSRFFIPNASFADVPLDSFSRLESLSFLLRRNGHSTSPETRRVADQIADDLGDHPLALSQARAYIEQSQMSLQDFLNHYRDHRTKLFGNGLDTNNKREQSVTTTWDLNFLSVAEQNPFAIDLLKFLCFLFPHEIPREHFINQWREHFQSQHQSLEVTGALQILLKYSLLHGRDSIYKIHPLVQQVVLDRLTEEEKGKFLKEALVVVSQLGEKLSPKDEETKAELALLMPHFKMVASHCSRMKNSTLKATESPLLGEIFYQQSRYYYFQGAYAEADKNIAKALAIQAKAHGQDPHPAIASSLRLRASIYWWQGELDKAQQEFESVLALWRKIYNNNEQHLEVANAMGDLGWFWFMEGIRYEKVIPYLERAFEIRQKLSPNTLEVAISSAHLARALSYDQGDFHRAKEQIDLSLEILQNKLNLKENMSVAEAFEARAQIREKLGNLTLSQEDYEKAIQIKEQVFKTRQHPLIAQSLNRLARVLTTSRDFKRAEECLNEALAIQSQTYKTEHHPDLAITYYCKALTLHEGGKLKEAAENLERSLKINEGLFKNDLHHRILPEIYLKGLILRQLKDFENSDKQFERANRLLESSQKEALSHRLIDNLTTIGLVLKDSEKGMAKHYLERSIEIQTKFFHTNAHYKMLDPLMGLAAILESEGDYQGAIKKWSEAHDLAQFTYRTKQHPSVLKCADALKRLQTSESESKSQEVLEKFKD